MEPARIDPYETLGVRRDATAAQVARAYHRLAKELHPDLRGEATAKRMREVNAAWEILSDPTKRAAWDGGQDVVAEGVHWTPGAPSEFGLEPGVPRMVRGASAPTIRSLSAKATSRRTASQRFAVVGGNPRLADPGWPGDRGRIVRPRQPTHPG